MEFMEMDFQLSFIAIGVACVTAAAVYLVSVYGIKEKSFEEAIAEQKKRSDDLLGSHHHHNKKEKKKVGNKDKNSSKKLKKRDKLVGNNNNLGSGNGVVNGEFSEETNLGGSGDADEEQQQQQKPKNEKRNHVEIIDEPEIMDDEDDVNGQEDDADDQNSLAVPRANSRRSSVSSHNVGPRRDSIMKPILLNKDETPLVQSSKHDVEPANHFEQIHPKDDCELRKSANEIDGNNVSAPPSPKTGSKSSGSNTPVDEVQDSPQVSKRPNKGNKQKNKHFDDDASMTAPKIEKIIGKLPLTSSEIQNLIDVLLNKQHAGDSEWINKGKNDQSVAGLKKQIELKDKLLSEEQTTVSNLQIKLKELRNEFSSEKTKYGGVRRQLEEQLQLKNVELQNLHLRLNKIGEMGMHEKNELQKQLQAMQIKLKVGQEEYEALKADFRNFRETEQNYRSKADSSERESAALKAQNGHLEGQLQTAFASNQDMNNQILNLRASVNALEERKKNDEIVYNEYRKLQEREGALLNELANIKANVDGLENENGNLRSKLSLIESNVKNMDDISKKYEDVKKSEVSLRNIVNELKGEVVKLEDDVKAEKGRSNGLEGECQRLREAVEEGKKAVAESKVNGEVSNGLNENLRLKEEEVARLSGEVQGLKREVDEKQGKNDELRHKNQKLLESLQVTEKSLQTKIEAADKFSSAEEERKKKAAPLLKCILEEDVDVSKEDWLVNVLTRVKDKVSVLQLNSNNSAASVTNGVKDAPTAESEEKTKQLEDEVVHYQAMLKQTETLLSTLQASINVEEAKWVTQNSEKDKEIDRLNCTIAELKELESLAKTVEEEKAAKSELEKKCSELEARVTSNSNSDNSNETEDLKKSNETLRAELESARNKYEVLSIALAKAQQANHSDSSSATTTPITNGSNNIDSPKSSNNDNSSKSATSTPPVSPTTNASSASSTPQQQQAPPSPSMISTASSSPPKEKKKKKTLRKV